MPKIEIYSNDRCQHIEPAKALFRNKDLSFTEYQISQDREKCLEMIDRSGNTTVPQIFIDGLYIGDTQDLYAAESAGELDQILVYVANDTSISTLN